MKYVSAFQPRYQFNHCAPAVVWLMVWVLCFTDPLSAATPVPWERNLVVNGVARAGNMSCWTQESLYPTDIEWKCQLTTTRACDLGTMFSGPTGISPQSLHMCRISQRIFIAPILAEMNTLLRLSLRRQRVLIHTSASLAAYNDASSFSVRQLNSNGVIVANADRVDFNQSGTAAWNCVLRSFVSNNMSVHSSASYLWISFACLMVSAGNFCDGWGTNFSLSLHVESLTHSLSEGYSSTTQSTTTSSEVTNSALTASDKTSTSLSHSISQEASPSFSESSTSWPTQSPTKQMTTEGTLSRSTTTSTCVSDSVTFRVSKTLLASPTKYSPTETISTRSMSVVTQHPTWSRQSITQSPSIRPTSTVSPTHTSSVANPNVLVVATAAPITAATQGVSAGVAATAAIFAASSAGGALMQASLGSAPCANNNGGDSTSSTDRSSNPAMYLISPFYGINDYAMVLGNIALVVTAFLLHVIGASFAHRFRPHSTQNVTTADLLAQYRFPNASMQVAVYAVQGVALGGWGLLWDVINPTTTTAHGTNEGGDVAGKVITWLVAISYPTALLIVMWRCRVSVAQGDGVAVKFIERFFPICMFRGFAPVDEFTTDTGAMVTNVWTVPIPAGDYPSSVLHFLGPNSFWRPRDARLMFGATFTSYKPTSLARSNTDVASLVWLAGDVLMLPTIICIASTTKPPSTARWATCNGVMLAAGLLLLGYAIALAYARPYRIGARNVISPLVVVWMATTCLLACPLMTDRMTTTSADTARGAVSLLQSITVLLLAASEVTVFFSMDRNMALRELLQENLDHDEASDALVEEKPIADREESSALCAPQEGCTSFPVLVDMPLFQPLLIEHNDDTSMSSWWRQQADASDCSHDVDAAASSLLLFPIHVGLDDDNISPQRKPLKTDLEVLYGSFHK